MWSLGVGELISQGRRPSDALGFGEHARVVATDALAAQSALLARFANGVDVDRLAANLASEEVDRRERDTPKRADGAELGRRQDRVRERALADGRNEALLMRQSANGMLGGRLTSLDSVDSLVMWPPE